MTEENKSRRRANKQARIHILVPVNPKRKGTLTYDRFALYEDGMTVAEYVKAGGRTGDVNHDATMGYIELTHA